MPETTGRGTDAAAAKPGIPRAPVPEAPAAGPGAVPAQKTPPPAAGVPADFSALSFRDTGNLPESGHVPEFGLLGHNGGQTPVAAEKSPGQAAALPQGSPGQVATPIVIAVCAVAMAAGALVRALAVRTPAKRE